MFLLFHSHFFVYVVLGFEVRVSCFLGRCSVSLSSSFFCFSYFSDRVLHFYLGPVSHTAGITGVYHHVQLIDSDGVLLTFCPGWPQTAILLISISQVAEITGMSHCTWPVSSFVIGPCYVRFSCLCLSSLGITGMHHDAWCKVSSSSVIICLNKHEKGIILCYCWIWSIRNRMPWYSSVLRALGLAHTRPWVWSSALQKKKECHLLAGALFFAPFLVGVSFRSMVITEPNWA
jgi:hypothetical protein